MPGDPAQDIVGAGIGPPEPTIIGTVGTSGRRAPLKSCPGITRFRGSASGANTVDSSPAGFSTLPRDSFSYGLPAARERLRQEIETENRIEGAGARRKKQRRALQVLYQRFLGDRAEWIVRSKCAFGFAPDTAGMRDEIDQPDGLAVLGRDRLVPAEPRLQRVGELHGTPEYP